MAFKEYEVVKCPFCNGQDITLIHFLGATRVKMKKTATFGSGQQRTKSSDTWVVTSDCSKCGKTADQIEKKLIEDGVI